MKRERTLQVVLVVLGLFYSFWGYLLFDDLWHSKWLGHSDVMPMFLSLNTVLGVFLLLAVKHPGEASLRDRLWGLVKPWPRVHDDHPIGGGLGARDAQEG